MRRKTALLAITLLLVTFAAAAIVVSPPVLHHAGWFLPVDDSTTAFVAVDLPPGTVALVLLQPLLFRGPPICSRAV